MRLPTSILCFSLLLATAASRPAAAERLQPPVRTEENLVGKERAIELAKDGYLRDKAHGLRLEGKEATAFVRDPAERGKVTVFVDPLGKLGKRSVGAIVPFVVTDTDGFKISPGPLPVPSGVLWAAKNGSSEVKLELRRAGFDEAEVKNLIRIERSHARATTLGEKALYEATTPARVRKRLNAAQRTASRFGN